MADSDDKRTEHVVTIGGVEHTMLLTDDDAKRLGAEAVGSKAKQPANKSRTTSDK